MDKIGLNFIKVEHLVSLVVTCGTSDYDGVDPETSLTGPVMDKVLTISTCLTPVH